MRIGSGHDLHRFGPGDHVMLGGVRIAHDRGLVAHSDGDVVLHALMDALLGAAGAGDIGQHFPDSDARWAGADSRVLLREVRKLIGSRGFEIANCDVTLVAEAPRIAGHREAMCSQHRHGPRARARSRQRQGDDCGGPGRAGARGGHRRARRGPAAGRR